MSIHSHSRCWLHLVWSTKGRQNYLVTEESRKRLHGFLICCAQSKGIHLHVHYVNPDHVHALIDLPTSMTIEYVAKTLKGISSHWINQERLISTHFAWGRGYGAFSVSQSVLPKTVEYIKNQEEHHRKKSFDEELKGLLRKYGLDDDLGKFAGEEAEEYESDYAAQCGEVMAFGEMLSVNR